MTAEAKTSAIQGVQGGVRMFAENGFDPEKLASQGSAYVLAVMLFIMLYAIRTMWNKMSTDSKEYQTVFLTAQREIEKANNESTKDLIRSIESLREQIRTCRTQGLIDEARSSESGTRLGRVPLGQ